MKKLFSREVDWRRTLSVSLDAAVILILGFLIWYFVLYLSLARNLENNQRITNEMRQINELNNSQVNYPAAQ